MSDKGKLYFDMARERIVLKRRISNLESEVEELQERLETYGALNASNIPPIAITAQVREWMYEYGMPWEIFYCYEHKQWVDELDNSFPYHIENLCPGCRAEEDSE